MVSVLSGNRNFEGRIQPEVAMNYLASPPLVIAYALAGTMDIDMATEPLGQAPDGRPVFLADVWPEPAEVHEVIAKACRLTCSPMPIATCSAAISDGATSASPTVSCSRGTRLDLHPPSALSGRHGH